MNETTRIALAFAFTPGGGPVLFRRCVEVFETADRLAQATIAELANVPQMPRAFAAAWTAREAAMERADREISEAAENGIEILTPFDAAYPDLLRKIYDPPVALYVKGRLSPVEKRVAIVGSRETSPYGENTASGFARTLAEAGVTVVSGLARGIDSAAHAGAVEGGGVTWAVLGGGLLSGASYRGPKLASQILEKGAILSEYPLHETPRPEYYPRRNRIVSGLSQGVVVIEAARRSGALITAGQALEQNRDVFAVPANIDSVFSEGSNWLLREGAKAVFSAEDVLEDLGFASAGTTPRFDETSLTAGERAMIGALSPKKPLHLDEWIGQSGRPSGDALALIGGLVLKGVVSERPGKYYALEKR